MVVEQQDIVFGIEVVKRSTADVVDKEIHDECKPKSGPLAANCVVIFLQITDAKDWIETPNFLDDFFSNRQAQASQKLLWLELSPMLDGPFPGEEFHFILVSVAGMLDAIGGNDVHTSGARNPKLGKNIKTGN